MPNSKTNIPRALEVKVLLLDPEGYREGPGAFEKDKIIGNALKLNN